LVTLGRSLLIKYPEFFRRFSKKSFKYNKIQQNNRNTALQLTHFGVDGIKSGHTDAAGYGLLFSALKDGRRLVGVVNGCKDAQEVQNMVEQMLVYGYGHFVNVCIAKAGQVLVKDAAVFLGDTPVVNVVAKHDIVVTLPKNILKKVVVQVRYRSPIKAPIEVDESVAQLEVVWPSGEIMTYPLVSDRPVKPMVFWKRPFALIKYWLVWW